MNNYTRPPKRAVLYARVSTQEQTKGKYPSCESQLEELRQHCQQNGWEVVREVKDEGYSAGTLKRPGLTEVRWLLQSGECDVLLCSYYDRLIRSRDFYALDAELRSHNVEFTTLHDPQQRSTPDGRLSESLIVAVAAYQREQTAQKVRTKMRMRADRGMWHGGQVPFAFTHDPVNKAISPNPSMKTILEQMFRIYIETRSDFRVRDWLKAHQILTVQGRTEWPVASVRAVLTNRLYLGEVEIGRQYKGVEGLPEDVAYHVGKAPFEPLVSEELFDLAQAIRQENAAKASANGGATRSYSKNKVGRVYPLQGILRCGVCGHAMSPYYIHHRPGKNRRSEGFVHYYVCAYKMRHWKQCDHKNLILAKKPETWILDGIRDLATSPDMIERVVRKAIACCEPELKPIRDALSLTKEKLRENDQQVNRIVSTIASGLPEDALIGFLNERAKGLKIEREQLRAEERKLIAALVPVEQYFDAATFRGTLQRFSEVVEKATPEELQKLLRLMVRKIEWMPEGDHRVQYYHLPKVRDLKTGFILGDGLAPPTGLEPVTLRLTAGCSAN